MENLKYGTKIKWGSWNLVVAKDGMEYAIKSEDGVPFVISPVVLSDDDFEILEEIDIDSIEEVKHIYIYNLPPNVESVDDRVTMNEEKINELIKAVKQLYRMTKEEK